MSDAQRQLYAYQREMLAQASNARNAYPSNYGAYTYGAYGATYNTGYHAHGASATSKPDSPKLTPMADSPGPVTPLELEGDSYLTAGASQQALDIDKLLREESKRRQNERR